MASFTQRAIMETFLELLDEKPIEKITVKEIVENCGINRNTFYYHFDGIPSLVEAILKSEAEKAAEEEDIFESWQEHFINAAKFCIDNKKKVYHIYNSVSRETIENYLNSISEEVMRRYIDRVSAGKNIKEEDKRLLILFYRSALTGISLDWVANGMKYDYRSAIQRLGIMFEGQIEYALNRVENQTDK